MSETTGNQFFIQGSWHKLTSAFFTSFYPRACAGGRYRQKSVKQNSWSVESVEAKVCLSKPLFLPIIRKIAKCSCCFTLLCGLLDWLFWLFIVQCRAAWLVECLVCAGEAVWFSFWQSHCANHSIHTKRRMQTVLTSKNNRVDVKEVKSLQ